MRSFMPPRGGGREDRAGWIGSGSDDVIVGPALPLRAGRACPRILTRILPLETVGADRPLRDLGQFASNLMIHVSVVSTCL
jgi:hypothetical protein